MHNATQTVIPVRYPELEREAYLALEARTERETEIPPASTREALRAQAKRRAS